MSDLAIHPATEAAGHRLGLRIHATVWALVSLLLITINLLVIPDFLWFFFPVTGMGIGVAAHAWFSRNDRRA